MLTPGSARAKAKAHAVKAVITPEPAAVQHGEDDDSDAETLALLARSPARPLRDRCAAGPLAPVPKSAAKASVQTPSSSSSVAAKQTFSLQDAVPARDPVVDELEKALEKARSLASNPATGSKKRTDLAIPVFLAPPPKRLQAGPAADAPGFLRPHNAVMA